MDQISVTIEISGIDKHQAENLINMAMLHATGFVRVKVSSAKTIEKEEV